MAFVAASEWPVVVHMHKRRHLSSELIVKWVSSLWCQFCRRPVSWNCKAWTS